MSLAERIADDLIYQQVPKGFYENLDWREHLIKQAVNDEAFQQACWICCRRSILFWLNSFLWLYEPRDWQTHDGHFLPGGAIPWISYPYQDDFLTQVQDAVGSHDVAVNKSRDMGASFGILACLLHPWQFNHQTTSFLCVSRNESYVEAPDNPKALFWKLDWMLRHQPGWLLPAFARTKMKLLNDETSSVINGESTTGDVARGDRRTAILLDEHAAFDTGDGYKAMAATRDATKCRIFNSTPQGSGNAFYDIWHNPDVKKIALHWTIHPVKSQGLYLDEETGKQRSPWYDEEVKRCTHAWEVRSELDMDFMGSQVQFFDELAIKKAIRETACTPIEEGEILVDPETCDPRFFERVDGGRLKIWSSLSADGMPPSGQYVLGVDVSMGTGSSNSVISVLDRKTGEKTAEFASANISPYELARMSVAMCRFFRMSLNESADAPGFLIWEHNGPGAQFTRAILDLKFNNFFYRQKEDSINTKKQDKPGFWSDRSSKRVLLSEYKRAVEEGQFVNPSKMALQECLEYIFNDSGDVIHSRSVRSMDPSAAKDNHGDFVIADALAWRAMREIPSRPKNRRIIPEGSYYARQQERRQQDSSSRFRYTGRR